jgi:hypothetical protein
MLHEALAGRCRVLHPRTRSGTNLLDLGLQLIPVESLGGSLTRLRCSSLRAAPLELSPRPTRAGIVATCLVSRLDRNPNQVMSGLETVGATAAISSRRTLVRASLPSPHVPVVESRKLSSHVSLLRYQSRGDRLPPKPRPASLGLAARPTTCSPPSYTPDR